MAFHDVTFPGGIARGAAGGPRRKTEIVTFGSGREQRNARWAASRRQYNASFGIKSLEDLYAVIAFFEERQGKLHSFRFRDPFDHSSCNPLKQISATDQKIAIGDGQTASFPLIKTYGLGQDPIIRTIKKPRVDTILVAIDGTSREAGNGWHWDGEREMIAFDATAIPAKGAVITAGFEFDVPVRFDMDEITVSMSHFEAGEIPSIPLVEVLP